MTYFFLFCFSGAEFEPTTEAKVCAEHFDKQFISHPELYLLVPCFLNGERISLARIKAPAPAVTNIPPEPVIETTSIAPPARGTASVGTQQPVKVTTPITPVQTVTVTTPIGSFQLGVTPAIEQPSPNPKCCVSQCKYSKTQAPLTIQWHLLPIDPKQRQIWVDWIRNAK